MKNKQTGFSLIELVIAATILGFLLTVGVQVLFRPSQNVGFQGESVRLRDTLNFARNFALTRKSPSRVEFFPKGATLFTQYQVSSINPSQSVTDELIIFNGLTCTASASDGSSIDEIRYNKFGRISLYFNNALVANNLNASITLTAIDITSNTFEVLLNSGKVVE